MPEQINEIEEEPEAGPPTPPPLAPLAATAARKRFQRRDWRVGKEEQSREVFCAPEENPWQ